ncbi:hypothetical protein E2C01_084436 [Portunus trituberculatus]|uniref:Uncharacterized protein n=1 Tax=Portunus trituberculatus TaxID=210409 RepID=A0A5B7J414_PORTR|nr:hypothetical protein [Portunus trituberculatus]
MPSHSLGPSSEALRDPEPDDLLLTYSCPSPTFLLTLRPLPVLGVSGFLLSNFQFPRLYLSRQKEKKKYENKDASKLLAKILISILTLVKREKAREGEKTQNKTRQDNTGQKKTGDDEVRRSAT